MLTLIGKQDYTALVPYKSLEIADTAGDPLSTAQFQLVDPGSQISMSALQEVIIVDETVTLGGTTLIPAHNYLVNNNFNYGANAWVTGGTLSGVFTFPAVGTFGSAAKATLTFSNQAVGNANYHQDTSNVGLPLCQQYAVPGQQYCFSGTVNVTSAFVNAFAFLKIIFLDFAGNILSTISSSNITSSGRFSVQGTAPANTVNVRSHIGGTTTTTTNSGTATFTALQLEPMWFTSGPYVTTYPTPICDFLQSDSITLPDGTATRFNRVFSGCIVSYSAAYNGPSRVYTISANSAEWFLEKGAMVNASYNSVSDQSMITGIINTMSPRIIYAADSTLVSGTPKALAYRNVPIVYSGTTVDSLQFADNTPREVLNLLADETGFSFGTDAYYNVWYGPPYFNLAPYGFSDSPDNVSTFPYSAYSISYDATQLQNVINVLGATISVQKTESWNLQDGSHTETVQGGKTVNVSLKHDPNAIPTTVTLGGTGISCGQDTGTGYGTAQSIVTVGTGNFGTPGLLSFPSPGYAAGTSISVTYTYDLVIYVQVQSPGSISSFGSALYDKINNSDLTSVVSAAVQGEAQLQTYDQPRPTLKFTCQKLLTSGQVIAFTSSLDGIANLHFTVQKVTARSHGAGINDYEVEAGAYLDDFVDFFRNAQKAINRVDHSPTESFKQLNIFQQDVLTISDSLTIHT